MSAHRVAILQSNYIPWKGYFDLINSVDDFVLFDDVQFTRRDWRNRNKIKTNNGVLWLTVPVQVKGKFLQKIADTKVTSPDWTKDHFASICHAYKRAPYFSQYEKLLQALYKEAAEMERLSDVNFLFLQSFCQLLSIKTRLHWSSEFQLAAEKTERLVSICKQLNADEYISGPAAKAYLQTDKFTQQAMSVSYYDFTNYPEYVQLYPPFEHSVSIIDLLMQTGDQATHYMKSFTDRAIKPTPSRL